MSGGVYGGDEVGALVFDLGHHSFRIGYAGEEFPKAEIPCDVGVLEEAVATQNENQENSESGGGTGAKLAKKKRYLIGTAQICSPKANMEIEHFMNDGMIEDWDIFEALLDHVYAKCTFSDSSYHPALFSEPAWNVKSKREKLIELMFEKYNVPAFYLSKSAALAAFANGRATALVLDSGASQTSAVPVFDGYCQTQAVVRCPFGGNTISDQCKLMLEEQKVEVVPTYKIASKQVIEDLKASVLQLSDTPVEIETVEKLPAAPYEFPCGFRKEFLAERMKIPEALFDISHIKSHNPEALGLMPVQQVVATSVGMCDIDIRPSMYNSLIVTGGNTLIQGFVERLNYELGHKCPTASKLRVIAAPLSAERRNGPWIGGSMLASLGSFQQMWVSRQDYDEGGKNIVDKKCP